MANRVLASATCGEGPWVHLSEMKNPVLRVVGQLAAGMTILMKNHLDEIHEATIEKAGDYPVEGVWCWVRAVIPHGSKAMCFVRAPDA